MARLRPLVCLAVLLSALHCTPSLECGAGTVQEGEVCVALDAGPTIACGAGTTAVGAECVAVPLDAGSTTSCGPGTVLVSTQCVVALLDGGTPTTCGPGTYLAGAQCLAGAVDAGPMVVCGAGTVEHDGVCVASADAGANTITCGPGTILVGALCVPAALDGGVPGILLVPGSTVFSPDGQYAAYLGMAPRDGGPGTAYVTTSVRFRTLATGAEFALPMGATNPTFVRFAKNGSRALVGTTLVDLAAQTSAPLPLATGETLASICPDLDAMLVSQGATASFRPLPTGPAVSVPSGGALFAVGAQHYVASVSGTVLTISPLGQPSIPVTIPGIAVGNGLSPSSLFNAGPYVFCGTISQQNFAVTLDGGTVRSVLGGFQNLISPEGSWVVGTSSMMRVATGTMVLIPGGQRAFADDSTLYVLDATSALKVIVDGGAPQTVESGVERFSFISGGVVAVKQSAFSSSGLISITDATPTTTSVSIPSRATAVLRRGSSSTPLGPATFFRGGGPSSPWLVTEHWSWDVFSSLEADPANGATFSQP